MVQPHHVDNPATAEFGIIYSPKATLLPDGNEEYYSSENFSCPGMPASSRIAIFLNANITRAKVNPSEFNFNPVLAEFKFPLSIKCYEECVGLEYSQSENIRIAQFDNLIKLYSIRGMETSWRTVQFYIKTHRPRWILWGSIFRDIGIALLSGAILCILWRLSLIIKLTIELFRKLYLRILKKLNLIIELFRKHFINLLIFYEL